MSGDKVRVVVMMEGGVIHDILSSMPIEVVVLDADTEGADEGRIKKIILLDENGSPTDMREENYVSVWAVPGSAKFVDHYFSQAEAVEKKDA